MVDPRWRAVLTVTPYVVLGILIAYTLWWQWGQWSSALPTLALCVAYGVWIVAMRQLPFRWRDRPRALALFLAVLIVLTLLLVLREGYFGSSPSQRSCSATRSWSGRGNRSRLGRRRPLQGWRRAPDSAPTCQGSSGASSSSHSMWW